jgi:predicted secreted protein
MAPLPLGFFAMARPNASLSLPALPLLLLFACHGCSGGGTPPAQSAAAGAPSRGLANGENAAGDAVVHVEDDGKTLDLAAGGTITFKLASQAGTGFVWMPTGADPAVLAQIGDRTSEVESSAPGAAKVDVYRFVAQHAGSTAVEMDLQRPWTKSAPPARAIHVLVNVH